MYPNWNQIRPLQAPPKFIDMSRDPEFELKWNPIHPVNSPKKQELMKEEKIEQRIIHDTRKLGDELCEEFYDQGEMKYVFDSPEEFDNATRFWD